MAGVPAEKRFSPIGAKRLPQTISYSLNQLNNMIQLTGSLNTIIIRGDLLIIPISVQRCIEERS